MNNLIKYDLIFLLSKPTKKKNYSKNIWNTFWQSIILLFNTHKVHTIIIKYPNTYFEHF